GAPDGIGLAIAVELSRRKIHLVIVGRNPAKLKKASDIIVAQGHGTQVRTVVWDLAVGGDCSGAERLRQAIAGLEVGVLFNSAGATYPGAAYFHEVKERVWREVVRVNVEGMSHVTRVVLPGMVSRRRGAVVNVGSASSVAVPSFPFYAVYAATKA
ncbi:very-long-chain 3-oxoacyl-CoA reductase 1-like, partial [Phalaenopsis equestris]|uniref:very-long-chain 3-oxoacyl-CoA reductase 1-like n=1 Tax=Phalaenopsis equestris TaxID=78828 RepID=UPI0009E49BA6